VADTAQRPLPRARVNAPSMTRFGRELIAMTVLFSIYKFGRVIHSSDVDLAYDNSRRVWDLERYLKLPNELSAQHAMLAVHGSIEFANTYYAVVHLPATAIFLVWMYLRRPELYPPVRRAIIAKTAVALIGHIVFPLAPPRMLGDLGFVDTAALYGPNVYGGDPNASTLINQYAAMPSLHVGWSMLVAAGLIASFKTRWRWLWLLHPTVTAVAVVGTANHYWLDGIIAVILLAAVVYLFGTSSPIPWGRLVPRKLRRSPRHDTADYVPDDVDEVLDNALDGDAVDDYGIGPASVLPTGPVPAEAAERPLSCSSPSP
jgi:hypothetical protein